LILPFVRSLLFTSLKRLFEKDEYRDLCS